MDGTASPPWPREILQRVFSASEPGHASVVLSLEDRLQAMAVCSAWRDGLNPRAWPLDHLLLSKWNEAESRRVSWLVSTRPAVKTLHLSSIKPPSQLPALLSTVPPMELRTLHLEAPSDTISECLPALSSFPGLTRLELVCEEFSDEGEWHLGSLSALTALEQLDVNGWRHLLVEGAAALPPALSQLRLALASTVSINAPLPSLQHLAVEFVDTLQLGGGQLQLPQLASLDLSCIKRELWVDWSELQSLQLLGFAFDSRWAAVGGEGLSALTNLTSLCLAWNLDPDNARRATQVLHAAPPTVEHLVLAGSGEGGWQPLGGLHHLPHLTSLVCHSPSLITRLAPLQQLHQLQRLHFFYDTAASLSVEQRDSLAQLSRLRQLSFSEPLEESDRQQPWLEVLQAVLPDGCEVDQPTY